LIDPNNSVDLINTGPEKGEGKTENTIKNF